MDHIAKAEALRSRAGVCRSSADETTSADFRKCYRLLAEHYANLAKLEEDYAAGDRRLAEEKTNKQKHTLPDDPQGSL